jgi:hypothetical protein
MNHEADFLSEMPAMVRENIATIEKENREAQV